MLKLTVSGQYKRDHKMILKRGWNVGSLKTVLDVLLNEEKLDRKYHDHELSGNYVGYTDGLPSDSLQNWLRESRNKTVKKQNGAWNLRGGLPRKRSQIPKGMVIWRERRFYVCSRSAGTQRDR